MIKMKPPPEAISQFSRAINNLAKELQKIPKEKIQGLKKDA